MDGAMGSLLQQRGFNPGGSMWMSLLNLKNPELIYEIHNEYISAGADIITTNTFRTNPSAAREHPGINLKKLVKKSVSIALQAAEGKPVLVAGSNAPAEDCYQPERTLTSKELRENHITHIDLLAGSGCSFILNETQSHLDEIKIICNHCSGNKIPYVVSLFFTSGLRLLSGEELSETIKFVIDKNPLAIGFNCISLPIFSRALDKNFQLIKNYNWGFYLNCMAEGGDFFSNPLIKCDIMPEDYSAFAAEISPKQPSFIGACCGSSPAHIKKLRKLLHEKN